VDETAQPPENVDPRHQEALSFFFDPIIISAFAHIDSDSK
jgi:hypothetical protein